MKIVTITRGLILFCSVLILAACSSNKWEDINVNGATTTFVMPAGYEHGPLGKGHQYHGKIDDAVFKVVVYPRTEVEQDRTNGITDDRKILDFAKQIMTQITQGLAKQGDRGQTRYDGIVPNSNGYTVQYTLAVDDRTVYNRFFITPNAIFYVEASASDPKNTDVADFYEKFKP